MKYNMSFVKYLKKYLDSCKDFTYSGWTIDDIYDNNQVYHIEWGLFQLPPSYIWIQQDNFGPYFYKFGIIPNVIDITDKQESNNIYPLSSYIVVNSRELDNSLDSKELINFFKSLPKSEHH